MNSESKFDKNVLAYFWEKVQSMIRSASSLLSDCLHKHTESDISGCLSLDTIPNLYVWSKHVGDPANYTSEEKSKLTMSKEVSNASGIVTTPHSDIHYSESLAVIDGAVCLADEKIILSEDISSLSGASLSSILAGKYVFLEESLYFIPVDVTLSFSSKVATGTSGGTTTTKSLIADKAILCSETGIQIGFAASYEKDAYPTSGVYASDGLWYQYRKQLGE